MRFKKTLAGIVAGSTLAVGGVTVADNQINPFTESTSHFEMAVVSDLANTKTDKVKVSKDSPKVTLSRWNDEVNVTIKPKLGKKVKGKRALLSNKVTFKNGDVTAFVEPKSDTEFDIDFTLDKKPKTNVFEYEITGAEELDFLYQENLTDAQAQPYATKKGITVQAAKDILRPQNVVGSYAVYSKDKKNFKQGETNYGTGKLFHIYRPEAIDKNGTKVWATLSYTAGLLTVTVPQSFLDTAVYPVVVDPTFGYTTIGASILGPQADKMYGTRFTAPSDIGTLTSVSHAIKNDIDTGRLFKVVAVTQSTLTIPTNGASPAGTMPREADSNPPTTFTTINYVTPPTLSASTDYVLMVIHNDPNWANYSAYDSGTSNYYYFDASNGYTTPANPTDAVTTGDDNGGPNNAKLSEYITYTAAAAATSVKPPVIVFD